MFMELQKKNRKLKFMNKLIYCSFFFLLLSVLALFSFKTTCLGIKCKSSVKADLSSQEIDVQAKNIYMGQDVGRKLLGGPGSSPPRCTSKCGKCTPCKPVHVPVPPGTPVTAEYYPEAWRCKCGNKLYMP
ncbi:Epidermal patterning factor-like protein [Melia azedarach]|uniref:Epidermal patterning factor-like protein n=1 Tax=Melia azedarach TaxID=155640 RepID=A0ACC1Y7R2_MELAZ|nr:Epidermal patterning factor-like protein [Melia azedarach]